MSNITDGTVKLVLSILVPCLLAAVYLEHRNATQDQEIRQLVAQVSQEKDDIDQLRMTVVEKCK